MKECDRGRDIKEGLHFFLLLPCSFQERPFQSHEAQLHRLQQGEREQEWRKRDKRGRGEEKVEGTVVWLGGGGGGALE